MRETVRVLLADDHAMVRGGVRSLLEEIEGVEIVGEASNGREALDMVQARAPNLVIMDISMKELNGIEATAHLRAAHCPVPVLILSMHDTEEFLRRALKSGASGYLIKDCAPAELALAVDAVLRGETYISPKVSRHLVSALNGRERSPDQSSFDSLSPRQREVLQMIAEGRSTKQIAFVLGLSIKTVDSHRAALMDKLDIRDVAGLVLYAARQGLVTDPPGA